MVKFDLGELLRRRRVSSQRWMDEHGIETPEEFENWKLRNDHMYSFSKEFNDHVILLLSRGKSFLSAGFVFAPHIPLQMTQVTVGQDVVDEMAAHITQEITKNQPEPAVDNLGEEVVSEPVEDKKTRKSKEKKQVQTGEIEE